MSGDALAQQRQLAFSAELRSNDCATPAFRRFVTETERRNVTKRRGYSLAEAAKAVGVSKPTLFRAIKSGRLSATRRDDGSYDVDPAELHRAFPVVSDKREATQDVKRNDAAVLRAEIEGLRQQVALLKDERDDLREDRDRWREQATRLLPAQQPAERRRRRWWSWR
jgi:excisionase family DNA binding protein